MKKIIINGANGYVASNFINKLLEQNYYVIALVRKSSKSSAIDKMSLALNNVSDKYYTKLGQLVVYEYSLLEENFAMSETQIRKIFSGAVDYYHFAASLKYDLKSKDEIFETNINGLENSLKTFEKYTSSSSRFFFISTAYSCGKIKEAFKEEFYEPENISGFRNYYEQSKRFAENIVKKYIEEKHINAHVLRLSQVVGDSKTGITKTDYGIFDFAKRIHNLAYKYPNKTVRIVVDPNSTQNLISINLVVKYLLNTIEIKQLPVIMNFVAEKSVKNIHIINSICKLLPINIVPVEHLDKKEMSDLERIISIGMSFTGAYININLEFETKNLNKLILHKTVDTSKHIIFKMLVFFINELEEKKNKDVLRCVV